jgi:predicted RNA methylase
MQRQSHTYAERGNDLYETPAGAVQALLRVEKLPHRVWEPAAGRGAIVQVLRDAGHAVIASDICDYGFPLQFVGDFLTQTKVPTGTRAIVTNPPFALMRREAPFVAHALDLCPRVIVLGRLTFLEAGARTELLEYRGLARFHVFRDRVEMMHRDGWAGPKTTNPTAYAWFVFDRNHRGPATMHRISYDETKTAGNGRTGSINAVRKPVR